MHARTVRTTLPVATGSGASRYPPARPTAAVTAASSPRQATPASSSSMPAAAPAAAAAAASSCALALGVLGLIAALEPGVAAAAGHAGSPVLGDVAESSDFWSNVARYGSFFFSVLLGTAATAAKPVIAALKRSPASAAGVVAVAGLVVWGVSTTVGLMLGVGEGGSGPDDLGAFLDGLG